MALDYERLVAGTYDALYAQVRDPSGDREFYASLAAERGGPVLELGCGTGRVLLPIAQTGLPCVGVDPSDAMLRVFRAKDLPGTLLLEQQRMEELDLARRDFALATIPFRGFQHLLTVDAQLEALGRIRDHLAPGGWLALDVFEPDLARMAMDEPERRGAEFEQDGRSITRAFSVRRDQVRQVMTIHFRFLDEDDVVLGTEEIQMRWIYRFELEHLLWRGGFEPLHWWADYDRRPHDGSGDIITIARRR